MTFTIVPVGPGLNCTLTGTAEGVRAYAQGLREWDKDSGTPHSDIRRCV